MSQNTYGGLNQQQNPNQAGYNQPQQNPQPTGYQPRYRPPNQQPSNYQQPPPQQAYNQPQSQRMQSYQPKPNQQQAQYGYQPRSPSIGSQDGYQQIATSQQYQQSNKMANYMNEDYAQEQGNYAIDRAGQTKTGKKIMENEMLLSTQKKCCAPALNKIEEQVLHAPQSTNEKLVFRWNYPIAEYCTEIFEPYKANGLSRQQFDYGMNAIKDVENYDISLIRPNKCIVWFLTLMVLGVFTMCVLIWLWSDFWWGLIMIGCLAGFSGYCIYGIIRDQKYKVSEKCDNRYYHIEEILKELNKRIYKGFGVELKIGNRGAWIELDLLVSERLSGVSGQQNIIVQQQQQRL